ncbi:MAG: hypothetical protein KIS66_04495 [Fimbriimonadaceae bacterium]|nr:hypothetical protein [Fimbriimonadaceae bacterium]
MTQISWKTLATMMAAMAAVTALAQPGGPPPGGGPGQGPRMAGGMGMMGGPFLLMRADVQKELALSADQVAKLKKLAPPGGMMGGPGRPGGPGGQGGRRGEPPMGGGPGGPGGAAGPMAAFQDYQKKVDAILTKPQSARLQELGLQRAGPMSVLRPDIAEKLGVTEAQRKKVFEGLQSLRPASPPKEGEPPKMPSREEMRTMMKKAGDKVLAVLTADQKKRWQAMLGKPFKFQDAG